MEQAKPKKGLGWLLKSIGKLSGPFLFKSEFALKAWLLFAADIVVMVLISMVTVRNNRWYMDFTNAFTNNDVKLFWTQIKVFCSTAVIMIIATICRAYVEGWISLRWREYLTKRYMIEWIAEGKHYKMQLTGNLMDNPDQRITEDVTLFLVTMITQVLALISSLMTFGSFVVVLWNLSSSMPLYFVEGGTNFGFPGFLVIFAVLYAVIATFIAHLSGKPLAKLTFVQQRLEADFRYSLVRIRENSEQIALLRGEGIELKKRSALFGNILGNTFRTMKRTFGFSAISVSFFILDALIVNLILGPTYFMGYITGGYGAITQISNAITTVNTTFLFFRTFYVQFAAWAAVIDRLVAFEDDAKRTEKVIKESKVRLGRQSADKIDIKNLSVALPNGAELIKVNDVEIKRGEKVLIKGRTGAGKTTLFRVIAGIWPFGAGSVTEPEGKSVFMLPQKPYIPIGTLAEAICYPDDVDSYTKDQLVDALRDAGMDNFIPRLDEHGYWDTVLSGGEQQRVAVARAVLHKPDYMFFDEATASMDEPSEQELYTRLLERMKDSAIVSIGHRSSLEKFHKRMLYAKPDASGVTVLQDSE
ncbi:MAG: ABC transporter ATP-binding protein/permease [Oscillospiraceae bacterium]|jgi:putative ATP-binding cassette transporter|nr:ABC transporter ATP-binding protein/permease [Oscillospiraceae bacterium]